MKKPKISISVADLPIDTTIEKVCQLASQVEADGIEVFLGYKTRFAVDNVEHIAKKYGLKILSFHQPVWSFIDLWRDEKIFQICHKYDSMLVVHPPRNKHLDDPKTGEYIDWLIDRAISYDVKIGLENMPIGEKYGHLPFGYDQSFFDPWKIAEKYCIHPNVGLTIDTAHLHMTEADILRLGVLIPRIKNIHISDFTTRKEHLSLRLGHLPLEELMQLIKDKKYDGLITLELSGNIYYGQKYYSDCRESLLLLINSL